MDSARRFPVWAWWVAGLAVIIGIAAGVVLAISNPAPFLPPGLAEKREAVAKLRGEASRLEDVDVKPLVDLETRKDYRGAAALMGRALEVNVEHERLVGQLTVASEELAGLALRVEPDAAGAKAITAFETLVRLVQAEKKFYENRRRLYEITRNYYADLAIKKNPSVLDGLAGLVDSVNADLEKAQQLSVEFAAAARAFDEAAQR